MRRAGAAASCRVCIDRLPAAGDLNCSDPGRSDTPPGTRPGTCETSQVPVAGIVAVSRAARRWRVADRLPRERPATGFAVPPVRPLGDPLGLEVSAGCQNCTSASPAMCHLSRSRQEDRQILPLTPALPAWWAVVRIRLASIASGAIHPPATFPSRCNPDATSRLRRPLRFN